MGEILVPELEHLAADQDDTLGEHRSGELADAMKVLGVTDHRFLGGFRAYRDSGMKWHEDGHAIAGRRHPRQRLLARRPHRGRRPPRPGDPRGPAAGAGHLRRVRRLRPPRPHPGPPGGDVRRAAGRRAVVRPRPRRAVGHRQDLLGRDVARAGCARACARCARPATPRPSRGWTPTARCRRSSPPTTTSPPASTAGLRRAEDGGAARLPDPDHARRAVLRAVQQRGQRAVGRGVLPDRQGRSGASSARTASSRTSSPASRRRPWASGWHR